MYVKKELKPLFSVQAAVTAFDTVHQQGFYFAGEMHDFWEAVYLVDGSATATADDRVYLLEKGDLLFHKPMEFHRIWAENGAHRVVVISFEATGAGMEFFRERLFHLDAEGEALLLNAEKALHAAIEEYDSGNIIEPSCTAHSAKLAAEELLLHLYGGGESTAGGEEGSEFRRIVGVMRDNLDKNLTVAEIAKRCSMSPSTLKKRFMRYSDTGVIKYYTGMKMRRAIDMLTGGASIKEVSYALGFSSINYFHTVFRRELGVTPKSFLKGGEPKGSRI